MHFPFAMPSDAVARRTEVNRSPSVSWTNGAVSSCELHWTKDDAVGSLLYSPADMDRRREHDEEEADFIVQRAMHWKEEMKDLPDRLRLRLEVEPNEYAPWKYLAEFLDLDDLAHFEQECQMHLHFKLVRQRKQRARERRRRAQVFDPQELPMPLSEEEEPERCRQDFLKSDLGKYWEPPEPTTRRVRKRVIRFSPC